MGRTAETVCGSLGRVRITTLARRPRIRLRSDRCEYQYRKKRRRRRGNRQQGAGCLCLRCAQRKWQTLLRFAEDNKLALLNTFCTPKSSVSYTFQRANRGKGQVRLDYILTKQADRRLVRCVIVRSPPLKSAESNHNLSY